MIVTGGFREYDYGTIQNTMKYGSLYPPKYKIKRVTAPVALVYAHNDWLSSPIVCSFSCIIIIIGKTDLLIPCCLFPGRQEVKKEIEKRC